MRTSLMHSNSTSHSRTQRKLLCMAWCVNNKSVKKYNTEHSFKTLSNLMHLSPLELKKFSGEPDEFDNFVATFNEIIGNVVSSPAAKLVRLKSQLTGMAIESIKMCCTDSGEEGYNRAMNI